MLGVYRGLVDRAEEFPEEAFIQPQGSALRQAVLQQIAVAVGLYDGQMGACLDMPDLFGDDHTLPKQAQEFGIDVVDLLP